MPTSSFVESGFWCFDALFVPQQHPAREVQDTFYLSDPAVSLPPPKEYYERVSKVHEHGGYGSTGYRAPWSHDESRKLLLRTHTTASSAAMLWKLAAACRGEGADASAEAAVQAEGAHAGPTVPGAGKAGDDGFRPAKLFSIDRVFRNETMDATHLAEFHQVEGVVADRGLTLADLIGMSVLFSRVCLIIFLLCRRDGPLTALSWASHAHACRLHACVLQEDGHREPALQACVQSVH